MERLTKCNKRVCASSDFGANVVHRTTRYFFAVTQGLIHAVSGELTRPQYRVPTKLWI